MARRAKPVSVKPASVKPLGGLPPNSASRPAPKPARPERVKAFQLELWRKAAPPCC